MISSLSTEENQPRDLDCVYFCSSATDTSSIVCRQECIFVLLMRFMYNVFRRKKKVSFELGRRQDIVCRRNLRGVYKVEFMGEPSNIWRDVEEEPNHSQRV